MSVAVAVCVGVAVLVRSGFKILVPAQMNAITGIDPTEFTGFTSENGLCRTKKFWAIQYMNHMYAAMKLEYHKAWLFSMLVFSKVTSKVCAVWCLRFFGNAFTVLFTST